jgi:hypothetical protein
VLVVIVGQGAGYSGVDASVSLADTLYRLGFQGLSDMGAEPWVSVAELYQHADDAVKKIAYKSGVFLSLDQSITVTAGTAVYELPATHVYTLMAALVPATGSPQLLRLTPVRDLWALDGSWSTSSGDAKRCSLDAGSVGTITLYPNPITGGTLAQVAEEYPAQIQAGATTVALPTVLRDYLSYAMLAGARGKESEAAMPEMAKHYQGRLDLYEQIIEHLWGAAQ